MWQRVGWYTKRPWLSIRGEGGGQNWVKFGPRQELLKCHMIFCNLAVVMLQLVGFLWGWNGKYYILSSHKEIHFRTFQQKFCHRGSWNRNQAVGSSRKQIFILWPSISLGGKGSEIGLIWKRIVAKNCRRRAVGLKNRENLPTSYNDGSFDDLAFTTFEKRKFHFLGVTVQGCA